MFACLFFFLVFVCTRKMASKNIESVKFCATSELIITKLQATIGGKNIELIDVWLTIKGIRIRKNKGNSSTIKEEEHEYKR